jgi:tRNA(Arg) A34 adenosine deaminase TadA
MQEKITLRDRDFIQLALKLSGKSIRKKIAVGGPFGAIIVKNNSVVGIGYNRVLQNHDPTAHGEIIALRDACRKLKTHDLSQCILYTSCCPCPMCLAASRWANIKKIYYAASSNDAAKIGFRDHALYKFFTKPNTGIQIKAMAKTASCLMQQWQQKFSQNTY